MKVEFLKSKCELIQLDVGDCFRISFDSDVFMITDSEKSTMANETEIPCVCVGSEDENSGIMYSYKKQRNVIPVLFKLVELPSV